MKPKKSNKKLRNIFLTVGMLFSIYIGYFLSSCWGEKIDYMQLNKNMSAQLSDMPKGLLGSGWNKYSFTLILVCIVIYLLVLALYYTSKHNFMIGKEFGNAKFADVEEVDKKLSENTKNPEDIYTVNTEKKPFSYNMRNRQLSEHIHMTLNTRQTDLNNNILVIGGSGAGKSYRFAKPQLLTLASSFIITDPKGELLKDCGGFLKKHGYNVKVLNLLNSEGMKMSNHYNPFKYIRTETDVIKLVTNLIKNTTPEGSQASDPFWEKAESMFLQSLFFYVWLEELEGRKNFPRVLELMADAEFEEDARGNKKPSKLDELFKNVEKRDPTHPAVIAYNGSMRGAADTVRSIIISANARLSNLKTKEVKELLTDDEMDIPEIGAGFQFDKKTKTALFCVIPDNDTSYNFLVGMLYTQIFQELYYQADFIYGGKLPIHVTFLLDEFANVSLPDGYTSLLSTMRSREISSIIIIQNMAQIKKLFEKDWQTIPGNCDVLVYLGGNEQETHKYISESLGKATIDKRSSGLTKGKQGSSSQNVDVLGRELMLPDEVRKTDGKKCVILIRGFDPIYDDKIQTNKHPLFVEMDGRYVHNPTIDRELKKSSSFLNTSYLNHLEDENKKGGKAPFLEIDIETLLSIPDELLNQWEDELNQASNPSINEKLKIFINDEQIEKNREIIRNELIEKEMAKKIVEELEPFALMEYLKLKNLGYSEKALLELAPLLKIKKTANEIQELFDSTADAVKIKELVQILLKGLENLKNESTVKKENAS